jgi:hypothetical protein
MLTTDYLIIGSGAFGMTFADQLLTETDVDMAIVDRPHMPGGHWNDAYSFVRLHQPSAFYGVGSRPLGSNRIDESGFNKGYYELASGAEVSSYFERVMQDRFLPSGRVHYFPMCDYLGDGQFRSCLSGAVHEVRFSEQSVSIGVTNDLAFGSRLNRAKRADARLPRVCLQLLGPFRYPRKSDS